MNSETLKNLRFPIGEFRKPNQISTDMINSWIATIEQFPSALIEISKDLSSEELRWTYRPDGWSIKQVIHHCADSHMNSIIRFKLTLTEDAPSIRPYHEDRWANLVDGNDDDIEDSLSLLNGLHAKWVKLLRNISKAEMSKIYIHPEHGQEFRLDESIGIYAWHCEHHLAHIKQAIAHKGQF